MNPSATTARQFEHESHRIDQLVWDAMALRSGESVLFCGFANNLEWIKRAVKIGVTVSVVSDDAEAMVEFGMLPVNVLRGSTSMLPARDDSFDAAIAFHYLHETDPLFHANIVSELARVGKRCVIVEPAPPSDPLGSRIASLYSRAKRQLGQFETYNQIDYWRKLMSIVKRDVSCQTFSFMRTPPAQAVRDTVSLIIDTMAAEETPETYLTELRALAALPDAQLVPLARFVIVGASTLLPLEAAPSTTFRDAPAVAAIKPVIPASLPRRTAPAQAPPTTVSRVYSAAETEPEFPAVIPPPERNRSVLPPAAPSAIARNAFGLTPVGGVVAEPAPPARAGDPDSGHDELAFGVPDSLASTASNDFGWEWEPPDPSIGK